MDIYYTSFGIERQIEYIQSTTDLAFDQGIFEEKKKVGREFLFQNNPTASRVELTSGFPREIERHVPCFYEFISRRRRKKSRRNLNLISAVFLKFAWKSEKRIVEFFFILGFFLILPFDYFDKQRFPRAKRYYYLIIERRRRRFVQRVFFRIFPREMNINERYNG